MKPDQERVKNLLSDTVTLLCKNGLHYQKEMKVQGLLGITLDENEVFVVHINEKFGDLIGSSAVSVTTDPEDDAPHLSVGKPTTSPGKSRDGGSRSHTVDLTDGEEHRPPRAKKRRSSRDGATSPSSASAHSDSQSLPATSPASRHTDTLSSPGTSVGDHDRLDVPPEISIKKEHDILAGKGRDRSSCAQGSGATSRQRDDRNAMRETYSGLSLSDIQSGLAHLEQIPNLEGEVSGDGDDSVRQSTPGSSQDQSVSKDSPFITGLVRHQRGASSGQGDDSTGSAWDSSFGGTMPDQAAPGSSTWDPSQLPAARLQGTGGEESTRKYTWDHDIHGKGLRDQREHWPRSLCSDSAQNHDKQTFACHLCGKNYNRKDNLQRHLKFHDPSLFPCRRCGAIFHVQDDLIAHKAVKHLPTYND